MERYELPDFPLFNRLLNHANCRSSNAIEDLGRGISASYPQLVTDILHLRERLRASLSSDDLQNLGGRRMLPIAVSIKGSYTYVVALLAILALGGTQVLLSHRASPKEIKHILSESRPKLLLVEKGHEAWNKKLQPILEDIRLECPCLGAEESTLQPIVSPDLVCTSRSFIIDTLKPGIIIFTSGTTGPPKGALKAYRFFTEDAQSMADLYGVRCDDRVFHCLPVHHVTGTGTSIIPFLLPGACICFQPKGFNAQEVWERWKNREMTMFSGVPTMYVRLMEYFRNVLQKLPPAQLRQYVAGAQSIRALMSGSSALPRPQQRKWKELLGDGRQVLERYGSTEANLVFAISPGDRNVPDGSVGRKMAGSKVRLSEGSEGEIWVRSPCLFLEYINNPKATSEVYDEDGFFRTGDVARREGDYYFIEGRVSVDILKSGGYKISALDVEREILELDYVAEAAVVGIPDEEFGQRVAVVLRLHDDLTSNSLTLDKLRADLREYLAGYKLPTLLRVVKDIPKTESGKMAKRNIIDTLFPSEGHPEVQFWQPRSKL